MKTFMLITTLFLFSVVGAAQNCALTNVCKVDQTSQLRIVAENGDDFCYFTQDSPEEITITCTVQNVVRYMLRKNFWAHECLTSDFQGEVQWKLCRTGNATNIFSWDVTAGNLEKTGTLY